MGGKEGRGKTLRRPDDELGHPPLSAPQDCGLQELSRCSLKRFQFENLHDESNLETSNTRTELTVAVLQRDVGSRAISEMIEVLILTIVQID